MIAHIRPYHVRHVKGLVTTILPTANLSAKETLKPLGGETVNTTTRKGGPPWKKKKKCDHCGKLGHTKDKCWKEHPELRNKKNPCRDCKDKDCKWWVKPYGCKQTATATATANMITTREEIDLF